MLRDFILERAIEEAKKSTCHKQRHGCIIFKHKQILSVGYNKKRYCSKLNPKYKRWIDSLHAEQEAIIFSKYSLSRCSLLVIRLNQQDRLCYSKPCEICMGLIIDKGIRDIYYSDRNGDIKFETVVSCISG